MKIHYIVLYSAFLITPATYSIPQIAFKGVSDENQTRIIVDSTKEVMLNPHDPFIVTLRENQSTAIEFEDNNKVPFILNIGVQGNVIDVMLIHAETGRVITSVSRQFNPGVPNTITIPLQTQARQTNGTITIEPSQETTNALNKLDIVPN